MLAATFVLQGEIETEHYPLMSKLKEACSTLGTLGGNRTILYNALISHVEQSNRILVKDLYKFVSVLERMYILQTLVTLESHLNAVPPA